jgi:hypothetical protein
MRDVVARAATVEMMLRGGSLMLLMMGLAPVSFGEESRQWPRPSMTPSSRLSDPDGYAVDGVFPLDVFKPSGYCVEDRGRAKVGV